MGKMGVTRRDAIRLSLGGLSAASLAALAAGCSDADQKIVAAHATTSTSEREPMPTNAKWWLDGNFGPVQREIEAHDLQVVHGSIPKELTGLYVRNGSNPATGDSSFWFFGDGMGHGVRLERGKALWYRNRYVQTPLYTARKGFGQTPPGGQANQSNVSFIHHAGRLLSSGEVGFPFRLDPTDLSTMGVYDFGGKLTTAFTAHPKVDPVTGLMHSFGYGFVPPYLTYHVTDATGALIHSEVIDIPESVMMHDFAITERDVVFWDLPVIFDLDAATKWAADPSSGALPYKWQPEKGARIGIMPLGGPASAVTWYPIDPCYVFHGVNAYRDGDTVVADVCHLTSMFDPTTTFGGTLSLHRWSIDTASGRVTDDVIETDDPGELPSRDPRRVGRKHRYGYFVQSHTPARGGVEFGGLIKHDYRKGTRETWRPPNGEHAGEWRFIPVGDDPAEDAGYLLTYTFDDTTASSQLVIIDASDVPAGPVARIALPQRVPYGFHAAWVPA